jgi:exodeoxyribonuclease VII small subunit
MNQDTAPTGYAEALGELESILASLDRDTVDVDVLGDRVARAAFLIDWCRERIAAARLRVDEVVVTVQAPDATP